MDLKRNVYDPGSVLLWKHDINPCVLVNSNDREESSLRFEYFLEPNLNFTCVRLCTDVKEM